jgi:hypothetical protein
MTPVERILRNFALAIGVCTLHAVAVAQTPPPLPAKSGEAAGTLQAGKTSVELKHAYAMGPVDDAYHVMLADAPVAADMLAKELKFGGGQTLMRQNKLSGVYMIVGKDGFVRTLIPFVGEMRGSPSYGSVGKLDSFTATPSSVTGRGGRTLAQTAGHGWSYGASFDAALVKPQ